MERHGKIIDSSGHRFGKTVSEFHGEISGELNGTEMEKEGSSGTEGTSVQKAYRMDVDRQSQKRNQRSRPFANDGDFAGLRGNRELYPDVRFSQSHEADCQDYEQDDSNNQQRSAQGRSSMVGIERDQETEKQTSRGNGKEDGEKNDFSNYLSHVDEFEVAHGKNVKTG